MGVIESLKAEAEAEENEEVEELSEGGDGAEDEEFGSDEGKRHEPEKKNGDDKENSIKKRNDSSGESDVKEVQNGEVLVANEVPNPAAKRNAKRKKANAKELAPKRRRGRKTEDEAVDEGDDSPSSPLHLPSEHE